MTLNDKLSLFNESRILILKTLFECDDYMCGCDLVGKLDIPKNLLSYHIKELSRLGYIQEKRCGKNKRYSLTADLRPKVDQILSLLEII